ncbi:uncharacterized protein LOC111620852 [Centruroides sculpturatus]|uniref:uncharacterized protein LOC111620852 n=1 Tax=Centruroides sculpturatus TaxID=218467 RepID=UPI000C6D90AB|nr:uncharacterized protein LOC111620852 [Centruroides sculpturatus]
MALSITWFVISLLWLISPTMSQEFNLTKYEEMPLNGTIELEENSTMLETPADNVTSFSEEATTAFDTNPTTPTTAPLSLDSEDFSLDSLTQEFIDCPKLPVDEDEYKVLPNKAIYVPLLDKTFTKGNYVAIDDIVLVCLV